MIPFASLLAQVRACTLCAEHLPHGPRPVLQLHPQARILIVSQAPGRVVHASGVPFDDLSGDRLRDWMGISRETFYDEKKIAIMPMGLCFPGKGSSGDLPPRPECAKVWHPQLLPRLKHLQLTLLVGQHAQAYHLRGKYTSLTDTVRNWQDDGATQIPLPHPSPRNNIWLSRNPWFETELLPLVKARVVAALA
jgi:uracil-DNA glycosylase